MIDGSVGNGLVGSYAEPVTVVTLSGGKNRGTKRVEIICHHPDGRVEPFSKPEDVFFDGPGMSHTLSTPVAMSGHVEGRYWFDVRVDGKLATRITFGFQHELPES
jgi:hypothetical protein